jgi:hypothetical protein
MRTPLRRSIAQVLKIAALVADHYDSASGLTLTASRADLLKTLAQSQPRSYGAGDTFLTVPYRPILPRLDCHAWLSVRRPERRLFARSTIGLLVRLRDRPGGAQARRAVAGDGEDDRLGICCALEARNACRAVYLTAAWSGRSGGACGCTTSSFRRGSGALGAELAEKAAVVGSDPLLDDSSVVVEAEDVHEVHDDPGTGGFEAPGGRLRERLCERSFDPCLARDVLALGDDDSPPDGAVVEGRPKGPEVAGQSCVVRVEPRQGRGRRGSRCRSRCRPRPGSRRRSRARRPGRDVPPVHRACNGRA